MGLRLIKRKHKLMNLRFMLSLFKAFYLILYSLICYTHIGMLIALCTHILYTGQGGVLSCMHA